MSDWKVISAKRLSICEICNREFLKGESVSWSRRLGVIRCPEHGDNEKAPVKKKMSAVKGEAGASALAQYEKRSKADSAKVTFLRPRLAKLMRVDDVDSQTTKNWKKGAEGEVRVGRFLARFVKKHGGVVLNDRSIIGTQKNIDHILITEGAVFVIDAKRHEGLVHVKRIPKGTKVEEILYLGKFAQTKLVESMKDQVAIVSKSLKAGGFSVNTLGYLIFSGAEWPKRDVPTVVDGVLINGPDETATILEIKARRRLDVAAIAAYLESEFPPR
jgi:hypothetical protein